MSPPSARSAKPATALERRLRDGPPPPRANELDAFQVARRRFLAGERVDMSAIARELQINRVTLYRWVGSREQLLIEVMWSLWQQTFEARRQGTRGSGGDRVAEVITRSIDDLITHPGWQRQLAMEGELLVRLLTRSDAGFQPRVIRAFRDLLSEEAERGALEVPADLDELAYAVARISESFVYREFITGDPPDASGAGRLLRLLLR